METKPEVLVEDCAAEPRPSGIPGFYLPVVQVEQNDDTEYLPSGIPGFYIPVQVKK